MIRGENHRRERDGADMKLIRTEDAVGHVVTVEDIPVLLSMGKEHLYVWEMTLGMVHENDAAERLLALCRQENMTRS